MGKGFNNYMTKKFFHPSSKENIKRVWMAQQKTEFEKKKEEDMVAQYRKEQDVYENRALLGDEKAKLGLSFMYDAPPGLKKAEKEKEEGEPEYKFEWQRKFNAPREQYAKNDEAIRDQPFGIEVRNVRCIKCRQWGHVNTDRICPLFGKDLAAEPPQPKTSASSLLESMREDGFTLKQSLLGRMANPKADNEQMLASDGEDDPEVKFLKSLTGKQKKKLLKKLNKLQEGKSSGKIDKKKRKKKKEKKIKSEKKKRDTQSSDNESEVEDRKKKSKKKKRKSSSSSSDSESDSGRQKEKKHTQKQRNRHRPSSSDEERIERKPRAGRSRSRERHRQRNGSSDIDRVQKTSKRSVTRGSWSPDVRRHHKADIDNFERSVKQNRRNRPGSSSLEESDSSVERGSQPHRRGNELQDKRISRRNKQRSPIGRSPPRQRSHERQRSRSPEKQRSHQRQRSPERRQRSRSPERQRSHQRSRSPYRRRAAERQRSMSPNRQNRRGKKEHSSRKDSSSGSEDSSSD